MTRRSLLHLTVIFAGWIAVAACERASSSELRVDDLPRLVASEETRIGSVDDANIGFSRVGYVDVDRDGNVYVLEGSFPEIRAYGEDGSILARIGRQGDGPGEFERAPRFGVMGDTVWTVDLGLRRITLFDRKGTVLSTGRIDALAIPLPEAWGYVFPWTMRSDGRFTGHFAMIASSRNDRPTGVQPTDSIPVPFACSTQMGLSPIPSVGPTDRRLACGAHRRRTTRSSSSYRSALAGTWYPVLRRDCPGGSPFWTGTSWWKRRSRKRPTQLFSQ